MSNEPIMKKKNSRIGLLKKTIKLSEFSQCSLKNLTHKGCLDRDGAKVKRKFI